MPVDVRSNESGGVEQMEYHLGLPTASVSHTQGSNTKVVATPHQVHMQAAEKRLGAVTTPEEGQYVLLGRVADVWRRAPHVGRLVGGHY
jgi:hypothetical protein